MQCHACGKAVAAGDRFCTACGASLSGVSDDTQQLETQQIDTQQIETQQLDTAPTSAGEADNDPPAPPAPPPPPAPAPPSSSPSPSDDIDPGWDEADPVWAPTGPVDVVPGAITAGAITAGAITDAPTTTETIAAPAAPASAPPTATAPIAPTPTAEMPVFPTPIDERRGFRVTAVTGLSVLGAIVMMVAMFATVVTVSSDTRLVQSDDTPVNFRTGSWIPGDLADNLPIAGLIAVALLMAGGVAAGFGWRGGSGLAAGAGLAITGLATLTVGLSQIPIDAAHQMAAIPPDEPFTLTITRDVGYYLQIAAGAIGVIVFFASLDDAFGDRRRGLNPWIAALGALAGLVMAGGLLIPEGLAAWSDNWYVSDGPGDPPAMLLTARLVQLALLAMTSVIGFLAVRRWGLGLVAGGAMSSLWLTLSTLVELTDNPIGPGFRNPGATDMSVHGVTIIGASALAAFLLLAIVAAYDQAQHEP